MNEELFRYRHQGQRTKKRKCHEIGIGTEVDIVHAVRVLKWAHQDVADHYNVSVELVHRLIFKTKHVPGYLEEKL